jgi:hypothetical protein
MDVYCWKKLVNVGHSIKGFAGRLGFQSLCTSEPNHAMELLSL